MTLKEKFLPKMYCFFGSGMLTNSYDNKVAEDNAKECEKIADEFAIGFAEWKDKFISELDNWKKDGVYLKNYCTIKELLEIYKKEKGL